METDLSLDLGKYKKSSVGYVWIEELFSSIALISFKKISPNALKKNSLNGFFDILLIDFKFVCRSSLIRF